MKTLHPRLHAALLAVRDDPEHMATLEAEGIEPIDLVCVNLYPFERTVARLDVNEEEAVENIDIGGPTMIRAAAKNHRYVAVVVKPESYDAVLAELRGVGRARSPAETRHWLANEAFAFTARYDAAISRWFGLRYEAYPGPLGRWRTRSSSTSPTARTRTSRRRCTSRWALARTCSPGWRSSTAGRCRSTTCSTSTAARRLLDEFDQPACVIVKHNNPCGVAVAETIDEAYEKALACDPLSAFGGVIALNRAVDRALAERLHETLHRGPDRARLR